MDTRIVNHRRDRQQTRRILADLRIRYRDLPPSAFQEIDPVNQQRRALVLPHPVTIGGRH